MKKTKSKKTMKYVRCFFAVIFMLLMLTNLDMSVSAMNTGFDTEELSAEDKETFLSNVSISVIKDEPNKKGIECFDVSKYGKIAVGFSESELKTICVYEENRFLYGYVFESSGNFGIEWDDNSINVYFVRSDVIVSVDQTGEIQDILSVKNTIDNNSYRNDCIFSRKKTVADTEYTLKNDMGVFNVFASSYSRLAATNNGIEKIIYDVNTQQLLNTVSVVVGAVLFACCVAFLLIREVRRQVDIKKIQTDGNRD